MHKKNGMLPHQGSAATFVGRSQELANIQQFLFSYSQQAEAKQARGVLLSGEAGIGKTALAQEITCWAQEHCWCAVWCWLDEQHSSQVYSAWCGLLRALCTQLPWVIDELKAHPDVSISLIELLPELKEWILEKQHKEFLGGADRLWEAIATVLRWIGQRTNLLLVIDDVHWLDGKSRDVWQFLFHQRALPLVILGTYREAELSQTHSFPRLVSEWRREQQLLHIAVPPLGAEQLGMLLNQYPDLDAIRKHAIIVQAGGNPLFAEELALSQQDQRKHSPSIDAIFAHRLYNLSFQCRSLLEQGAIFGNVFEHAWVAYIAEKSGMLTDDQTMDALEEALRARLLIEGEQESKIVYQFWHPLLQEHLYRELSPARSQILHRSAAVSLAEQAKDHEEYAAIITRLLISGDASPLLIAQWAERAGHRAYRLAAYLEAEQFYKTALEHTSTDLPMRSILCERIGECCAAQGNAHASCYFHERAILWSSEEQIPQELARKALLWARLSFSWRYQGNMAEAMSSRQQMIALVELLPGEKQTACQAMLSYLDANLLWQGGKYEDAFLRAQEAVDLFTTQLQEPRQIEEDSAFPPTWIEQTLRGSELELARSYSLLGTLATFLARPGEARTYFEIALRVFEEKQALREIEKCCCNLGDLLVRAGAYTDAHQLLSRACMIAERIGDQPGILTSLGNLGILAFRQGDLKGAQNALAKAIAIAEQIDDPEYLCACLIPASYVEQDLKNFSQAAVFLKRVFRLSRVHGLPPYLTLALITLARLRLLQAQEEEQEGRSGVQWRVRAQNTLRRALCHENIELETRLEGELLQAEAFLQEANTTRAEQILMPLSISAERHACFWHHVLAQRLLGQLWANRGEAEKAVFWLQQALTAFQQHAMTREEIYTQHLLNMLNIEGGNNEGYCP